MKKQSANINILSQYGPMMYLVEYEDTNSYIKSSDIFSNKISKNNIEFYIKNINKYGLTFVD